MQGIYAVGVAGVALGIARAMLDAFEDLATRKTPRNLGRLADNATVQSNVAQLFFVAAEIVVNVRAIRVQL